MATTTNFGWTTPNDTDLVKDGAAAIRTLGQSIDTSMMDLKGGTTGQVLAKNSNTDMDFVWSADAAGMTNPMTTTGDTIYSSSGSTPARLGIGTSGQVLSVSAGVPAWTTPASGGKVLQVVSTSTITNTTIASTTYTDVTNMTLNITPTSATSKVLVLVTLPSAALVSTAGDTTGNSMKILRGATTIANYYNSGFGDGGAFYVYAGGPGANIGGVYGVSFLDSPATTSATTYKIQGRVLATANSGTSYWGGGATAAGSIILMEIGA